jgi:glycosyltransferase involved in cell wall biosynthesis
MPSDCHVHFTGNPARAKLDAKSLPGNVHFLGYLPEHDYWAAILGCDAVVDLSLMPDCLVCGAYEALAAGKPMILSDNAASRQLFAGAAVYSEPNSAAIRDALAMARSCSATITATLPAARVRFTHEWQDSLAKLKELLH